MASSSSNYPAVNKNSTNNAQKKENAVTATDKADKPNRKELLARLHEKKKNARQSIVQRKTIEATPISQATDQIKNSIYQNKIKQSVNVLYQEKLQNNLVNSNDSITSKDLKLLEKIEHNESSPHSKIALGFAYAVNGIDYKANLEKASRLFLDVLQMGNIEEKDKALNKLKIITKPYATSQRFQLLLRKQRTTLHTTILKNMMNYSTTTKK